MVSVYSAQSNQSVMDGIFFSAYEGSDKSVWVQDEFASALDSPAGLQHQNR